MVESFRSDFNARFTPAKYAALLQRMNRETGTAVDFRMAETPCFFPSGLFDQMIEAGTALTHQLLENPRYLEQAKATVPAKYDMPGQGKHPHFMTVDFGLVRDSNGDIQPKLVELQAFPSIFGFQPGFAQAYKEIFALDERLAFLFGGLDEAGYWALLRKVIVGEHDPENVILLEVDPEHQKTLADFRRHEQHLAIRTVDVATVVKQGKRLFYRDPGDRDRLVPIERIYNRVIVDEVVRREVAVPFDYRDELAVEWAGHPNWYFGISKFSIPFLQHETVPAAVYLDDWFAEGGSSRLPEAREEWVLKPLYSFAGRGIQFAPSDADLRAIPVEERHRYLLQTRVHFEPVIRTPAGMTQAEVRILYVWPDGQSMVPMTSLIRMGRGLMMGVDHNRDQTWVGGSAGLYLPGTL